MTQTSNNIMFRRSCDACCFSPEGCHNFGSEFSSDALHLMTSSGESKPLVNAHLTL
ncbi:hypothetical protein CY34DRAFT_797760 [Suillus luteus UH-Slu-Lm8-n1]|uniref:Uncharacterized protein n=1 Tax=Suillus luteus UH-Slu-Lm8-n1 TaxID=930992 RepID=A0A0D0C232_9AGAM|nr:hypothetical protein CY34DRAFT_797760 [Suillus luteus UH-Slu-Lm8-n1]